MNITFVRSNHWAVGEYRVNHPMQALRRLGHECRSLMLDQGQVRVANVELEGDILLIQHHIDPRIMDLRDSLPEDRRPKAICEIDDNPWEWHPWDSVHRALGVKHARKVSSLMARCDGVTCSTPTLAARVRKEFPSLPAWVVPNAIDFQLRDWETREDRKEHELVGKVVLGWTGSIHHERDGQAMLQALPRVLKAYPETVFLMQCDRDLYRRWTTELAKEFGDRLRWSPPVPFTEHPKVYSLFDINLAPLETTKFNVCKSDLRLIEGGAHGVPYVASKIAPYAEFHRQSGELGGYLASTVSEWAAGISDLLEGEREARGNSLRNYVRERRSLTVAAGQWQAAFEGVLVGEPGAAVEALPKQGRNERCPCGSGLKQKRCCLGVYA